MATLLGFGVAGALRTQVAFSYSDVLLPDSFALKFIDTYLADFSTGRLYLWLIVEHSAEAARSSLPGERYDYPAFAANTAPELNAALADEAHVAGPSASWLSLYEEWAVCKPCCARQCALCAVLSASSSSSSSSSGGGGSNASAANLLLAQCAACLDPACAAAAAAASALNASSSGHGGGAWSGGGSSGETRAFHVNLTGLLGDFAYGGAAGNGLSYDQDGDDDDCRSWAAALTAAASSPAAAASSSAAFAAECGLRASRFPFAYDPSFSLAGQLEQAVVVTSVRKALEKAWADGGGGGTTKAWVYDEYWLRLELYISLKGEVAKNVLTVAAIVLVVGLVLLVLPSLAVFVAIAIGCICVETLGFMHWWDVPLNPSSFLCIIVSIGLSVDYVSHVAYAFVTQAPGDRVSRTRSALLEMGPSVVKGGFTSWLGVSLAFLSPLAMFQYFVRPLTLGICLGVFHGVVFIPLACAHFGPDSLSDTKAKLEALKRGRAAVRMKKRAEERKGEGDGATGDGNGEGGKDKGIGGGGGGGGHWPQKPGRVAPEPQPGL